MSRIKARKRTQNIHVRSVSRTARRLDATIEANLRELGYGE